MLSLPLPHGRGSDNGSDGGLVGSGNDKMETSDTYVSNDQSHGCRWTPPPRAVSRPVSHFQPHTIIHDGRTRPEIDAAAFEQGSAHLQRHGVLSRPQQSSVERDRAEPITARLIAAAGDAAVVVVFQRLNHGAIHQNRDTGVAGGAGDRQRQSGFASGLFVEVKLNLPGRSWKLRKVPVGALLALADNEVHAIGKIFGVVGPQAIGTRLIAVAKL